MKWKKISNLITVIILSIAFAIITLRNVIAPLHMNAIGTINAPNALSTYNIIYFLFSLIVIWWIYFSLRHKPEVDFFTLMIVGIIIIITETFLWT